VCQLLLWSAETKLRVLIFNHNEVADSVLASALLVLVVLLVAGLTEPMSLFAFLVCQKSDFPWHD